ncbi:hypothetical protein, partial [Duganella vulcania]|uniref:hypothetical protein n=1 Tax=Duganella vulcania TaxID=2692166 RepID=UPI001C2D3DD1
RQASDVNHAASADTAAQPGAAQARARDALRIGRTEQQGSRVGRILNGRQGMLLHATKRNSDSDQRIVPASLRYQKHAGMQAPAWFWRVRSFTFAKELT